MTEPVLLDTHVWVWLNAGDRRRLSRRAVQLIEKAADRGEVLVGAISLWEVAMLEARGRLRFSVPLRDWLERAARAPGVRVVPLTTSVAAESSVLPDAVTDPADRLIAATTRTEGARLFTCDERLLSLSAVKSLNASA